MKPLLTKKRIVWLALAAAGILALILPGRALIESDGFMKTLAPQPPGPQDKGDPKLDYALNKFLRIVYFRAPFHHTAQPIDSVFINLAV